MSSSYLVSIPHHVYRIHSLLIQHINTSTGGAQYQHEREREREREREDDSGSVTEEEQ